MSMKSIGASGYIVKASDLTKLLPAEVQDEFTKAIENKDYQAVDDILNDAPDSFPTFESAFVLNAEDEADNLEHNIVYVCFQDEDLFIPKVNTVGHNFLLNAGIKPEFERWSTWG